MDKQIFWPILLAALAQLAPCLNGLDGPGRHKSQIGHSQDEKRELKFNRIQISVPPHRVFRFALNPRLFLWESGNLGGGERRPTYSYVPMTAGSSGLPGWISYKYSDRHKAGFIFGVPKTGDRRYVLDVVATNRITYETGLLKLAINVTKKEEEERASYAVKLKIDNLNLEDMFDVHRLKNLVALFTHRFWKESEEDLQLVFISSSLEVGYRRPLIPSLKDGVVLILASASNFSSDLRDLDRETAPLRKLPSCPRDFKRTSVERHFRSKGFGLDWCQFRLMELDKEEDEFYELGHVKVEEEGHQWTENKVVAVANLNEVYQDGKLVFNGTLPKYGDLGERDFTRQYLLIFGTTVGVGVIMLTLVFLLFCYPCSPCCQGDDRARAEKEYQGFHESLFLVIRDCITCCRVMEKAPHPAHVSAEDDFHHRQGRAAAAGGGGGGGGGTLDRNRRATSVQRQTDTLRRLAQQRDLTPRLQTPAPGTTTYAPPPPPPVTDADADTPNIIFNPNYLPGDDHLLGEDDVVEDLANSEVGGPVILLSDDGAYSLRSRGSSPGVGSVGYARGVGGTRPGSGFDMDPLGSLQRPVPPPYYEQRSGASYQEDKAYLV